VLQLKIIIIGGGQVGSYTAKLLLEGNNEITIVEKREKNFELLKKQFLPDQLLLGDGTSLTLLEKAGIDTADAVAVVTGDDDVNLVISTMVKFEYGINRVIARVNNPKNEWLYTAEMGVDVKINQADLLAHLVVNEIAMEHIVTLMELNRGDHAIIQITVRAGAKTDGMALKEIDLPQDVVIIAIKRGEENIVARGDVVLQGHDLVIAYVKSSEEDLLYGLMC
jgi:trk system potassium uptake protein TrkA